MRTWKSLVVVVLTAGAAACGDDDDGTGPVETPPEFLLLDAVHGDGQTGRAGGQLSDSLVVRVTDAQGVARSGVTVTWTPLLEGGGASPAASITDADGLAATRWTLGTRVGSAGMRAAVEGHESVVFGAQVTIGPAASIALGLPLPDLLAGDRVRVTATVTDVYGNAVLNPPVLEWESDDSSVVDLSGDTLIALDGGNATITASLDGQSESLAVFVAMLASQNISAGFDHTCALDDQGSAWCWGLATHGVLGHDGPFINCVGVACTPRPRAVLTDVTFDTVAAGGRLTCALETDGDVRCWGGPFGPDPVAIASPVDFVSIVAGGSHACGLTADGAAYCWGENFQGELGGGTTDDHLDARAVAGGHVFTRLAAGGWSFHPGFTCGLEAVTGAAYCWGANTWGQLGTGDTDPRTVPTPASGGHTFTDLAANAQHACAIDDAGTPYCWGHNGDDGRVGHPTNFFDQLTPRAVAGGAGAYVEVEVGAYFSCARTAAGEVSCWGTNRDGVLGTSVSLVTNSRVPVEVATDVAFTALTGGGAHVCGTATDGLIYCWGRNAGGTIGDGTTTMRDEPVLVLGQPR